jgi:hypothetical protein
VPKIFLLSTIFNSKSAEGGILSVNELFKVMDGVKVHFLAKKKELFFFLYYGTGMVIFRLTLLENIANGRKNNESINNNKTIKWDM